MAAGFTVALDSPVSQQFMRLLDASAFALVPGSVEEFGLPDDEMHRDILLPLLPAMIADKAIRKHWLERAKGIVSRLKAPNTKPQWEAADFEIHVAASYLAGPDARALSDTLLSEESLREMAAVVMNRVLDSVWLRDETPQSRDVSRPTEIFLSLLVPRRSLSKNRRFLNKTLRYLRQESTIS